VSADVTAQKDFLKFVKEINEEIASKPIANNPLSNIGFFTEPSRIGGMLTNAPHNADKPAATGSAIAPVPIALPLPPLPATTAPAVPQPQFALPPLPPSLLKPPQNN
jgi:hypothetical protein